MSKVVVAGNTVYLSGQVPDVAIEGVTDQTADVLKKIDELLAEGGTSKSSLLTATIWLKDIDRDFGAMNEVWSDWLDPENKPVRATVQADMASPKILVEVQVTAVVEQALLRFKMGDRVACNMGDDGWVSGTVVAVNYREVDWPEGRTAPYQVRLDNDKHIYAPQDTESIIRAE